jgi:hypothetical protein
VNVGLPFVISDINLLYLIVKKSAKTNSMKKMVLVTFILGLTIASCGRILKNRKILSFKPKIHDI